MNNAPEQGWFKAELLIRRSTSTSASTPSYQATFRASGAVEVSKRLGELPALPRPGSVPPIDYGMALFDWVCNGELRRALAELRELSHRTPDDAPSLRLLLRLEPESPLTALAWETLCPSADEPPLSVTTAFSRFVYERRPSRATIWERPIRILLVVSNPDGLQRFDLESVDQNLERSVLHEAERRLEGRIEVKRMFKPRLQDIRNEEKVGYHITHLLAHATTEGGMGGVLLADEQGKAVNVGVADVANAIASPSDTTAPHLVFLALPVNGEAPQGQVLVQLASLLISGGVQSVLVLQAPIEQELLTAFMERFYQVLLDTGAIDVAAAEARKQMFVRNPGSWDWTWPTLFTRATDITIQQRLPASLELSLNKITFGA